MRLATFLEDCGFQPTIFDPCVFVGNFRRNANGPATGGRITLYVSVYVDDIVLFGPQCIEADQLIAALKKEFEITDLGFAGWLLVLQISYSDRGIHLSQKGYIQKLLDQFGMASAHPVLTPLDTNVKLLPGATANNTEYRSIVGSLMYALTGTRPDLSFTITYLSQFLQTPSSDHMTAARRVLKYLRKTIDWDLLYPYKSAEPSAVALEGYVDASWGACLVTRHSYMRYIFRFGECTIAWKARKQRSVATSTTEAEYMAMAL